MTPAELTLAELVTRLRAWADGYLPSVAAVELLIAHGHWLRQPAFLACIDLGESFVSGTRLAQIDWERVCDMPTGPSTASEAGVLDVACSLGYGCEVNLRDVLLSCDETNVRHIAAAVLKAGGAR